MAERRMLTEQDREGISRVTIAGLEGQVIAARIGRCLSPGDRLAWRSRPKTRKIDVDPILRQWVVGPLGAGINFAPDVRRCRRGASLHDLRTLSELPDRRLLCIGGAPLSDGLAAVAQFARVALSSRRRKPVGN